jgi:hypothetical protein
VAFVGAVHVRHIGSALDSWVVVREHLSGQLVKKSKKMRVRPRLFGLHSISTRSLAFGGGLVRPEVASDLLASRVGR